MDTQSLVAHRRASRLRLWHVAIVWFDLIWFQGADRPSIAFCRPVLRRYSATEGGWIYARLGERTVGEMTW